MAVQIKSVTGYFFMKTWVMANIVQLATLDYCDRFLGLHNDPKGRQLDQMTQAARSITANIAEGLSRHQTSVETEMKLLDVARASASELQGDYFMAILHKRQAPWSEQSAQARTVAAIDIDRPAYTDDLLQNSAIHILQQMSKFSQWLDSDDEIVFANCLLILCKRLSQMLQKMLEHKLDTFKQEGGFRENMTKERIAAQQEQARQQAAPTCPECGKPMKLCTAGIGHYQGHQFWGCTEYPNCRGRRELDGRVIQSR